MASRSSKPVVASHTAGIFADMTLDGPEIGTLVVVVDRAKNLPNRKTMGKQDPYCAMRLGKEAKKTETDRRGGQTPRWDQELRFTVHDSPDYYKLKLSIFNDDKRADLIGEAFISLADLIKPGGGSNDLWHQLSYKGKYAGDIRIEMTYYDMRPREEKTAEKRRQKDRVTTDLADSSASSTGPSGPRQLGPREVRRRPLPANPGQPPSIPNVQQRPMHLQERDPTLSAVLPEPHLTPGRHTYDQNEAHEMYADSHTDYNQPEYNIHETSQYPLQPVTSEQFRANIDDAPPALLEQAELGNRSQRRRSYVTPDMGHTHPYDYAPSHGPHARNATGLPMDHSPAYGSMTMDPATYRESSFRQSMVLPEQPSQFIDESVMDDAPPPPPPRHQQPSRKSQSEYPPSSFMVNPVRPTPIRPTVEERSPLQNIEHKYGSTSTTSLQLFDEARNTVAETTPHHLPAASSADRRQRSYDVYEHHYTGEPTAMPMQPSYQQQYNAANSRESRPQPPLGHHSDPELNMARSDGQHVRRNSINPFDQNTSERPQPMLPNRPRSYDDELPQVNATHLVNDPYMSSPHAQSMPTLPQVDTEALPRARPQHRQSMQTPIRKAVSPSPYHDDASGRYPNEAGGRRLNGVPFGPDAYDVLNPASSPVTNENTPFETPEQARFSAHVRASRVAEDIGPIVDNNGRVIDPSDHLPTSTWAPEPERKQRKPEHVIHYRTRNNSQLTSTPGSSPASLRLNMHRSHPNTPLTNSPNSAPPSSDRSRAHRPIPNSTRPLPAQPFQHSRNQSNSTQQVNDYQPHQRNSYHEGFSASQRPALSEYQVPVHNNYVPRNSAYPTLHSTPPRMPMPSGRCSQNFDDPLAAELSMIDIGPLRGLRAGPRMSRGY